jgi:hypothetical protein
MADLIILAEDTQKIAMAQKYCPRPAGADQGAFFAEMRGVTGDNCLGPGPADPFFIGKPVNFALPGTNPARRQPAPGLGNTLGQLPLFMEGKIPGLCHFFFSVGI